MAHENFLFGNEAIDKSSYENLAKSLNLFMPHYETGM